MVQCRARFSNNEFTVESPNATLFLEGILGAVGNLALTVLDSSSVASLSWTEPSRLKNPIDNTPEITYCVKVINASASEELFSECDIQDTGYNFTLPPMTWCYLYVTVVTPSNTAGLGQPEEVAYFGAETAPHFVELIRVATTIDGIFTYILTMASPVCEIELTFLDFNLRDQDTIILRGSNHDVNVTSNIVTLSTEQLTTNRLYQVTIEARNIAGLTSVVHMISTHDVKNTSLDRQGSKVTAFFSENSTASGALFSLVFITGSGDVGFNRSFLLALDRNTSLNHTLPFGLYTGRYLMHVYDIEHDGTLLPSGVGYPAVTNDLTVSGTSEGPSFQVEYSYLKSCRLDASSGYIDVYCSYPYNSVATGFQVIAQMRNFSQVHKLYTGKTTNRQNRVTVEVTNGEYQVEIFAIREETGMLHSRVEYREPLFVVTSGGITEAILIVILVIGILLIIACTAAGAGAILMQRERRATREELNKRRASEEDNNGADEQENLENVEGTSNQLVLTVPKEYEVTDAQNTGEVSRHGEFSTVYKVIIKGEIEIECLGRVLERQPHQEELKKYCHMLKKINHKNIVKFKGCFIDQDKQPVFVMEIMNTTLDNFLMQEKLSLSDKFRILLGIAKALEYLHEQEVTHGMVIACNVYIDREPMTAKIAYLENAITRKLDPFHMRRQSKDTLKYMPPEIKGAQIVYSTAVDIFSFGHLTIYTINQEPPELNQFGTTEEKKRASQLATMCDALGEDILMIPLIKQCLSDGKGNRPAASIIVKTLNDIVRDEVAKRDQK